VRARDWQLVGELMVTVAAIRAVSAERQAFAAGFPGGILLNQQLDRIGPPGRRLPVGLRWQRRMVRRRSCRVIIARQFQSAPYPQRVISRGRGWILERSVLLLDQASGLTSLIYAAQVSKDTISRGC
jgi:hypothetical protein